MARKLPQDWSVTVVDPSPAHLYPPGLLFIPFGGSESIERAREGTLLSRVEWLRETVEPLLAKTLGFLPLFQGPHQGFGMLAGGIILAIMITPTISSVSREVLRAVPHALREGAIGLGATRWEVVRVAVLPYAKSGLVGAVILGLGRALGETMAITMVIGNRSEISVSLFAPSYSMASVIANEFTEATGELYLSALAEVGLVLFFVTVLLNVFARLLVWRVGKLPEGGRL